MSEKPADRRWNRLATLERVARNWGDAGPLIRLLCEHDRTRPVELHVTPTVDRARFIELIEQSQLLTRALVESALEELVRDEPAEADNEQPQQLALRLVEKQLLSTWQAEKLLIGKYKGYTLANYRIAELLGSGAFSSIYRAEHQMMRRPVAIQVLTERFARHQETRELFFQRARVAATLDHKNLVHVFDMGEQRSLAYVVMEYVPGYDLERLVRRVGPLPLDLCAAVVLQISRGLAVVHAARQTLAGLQPSDVVLDTNGVAHILTLRLAATLAHHPGIRASLGAAGVPRDYFSDDPQLRALPDQERDRFALGLMLYFLLMAQWPDTTVWQQQRVETTICEARPDHAQSLAGITASLLNPDSTAAAALPAIARQLQQWLEANQV